MKRKILYLYAELANYQHSTFTELVKNSCQVDVIFWDKKKLTPYTIDNIEGVNLIPKSSLNNDKIIKLAQETQYDIIYMSGWIDQDYIKICRKLRASNFKIVVGSDTPWYGSFRQYVACIISKFYHRKFCTHIWVAGLRQYEYARRLGFKNENIIYNCLSADITKFRKMYDYRMTLKSFKRTFFFVGRNDIVKNVDFLLQAYRLYCNSTETPWDLQIIGGDFNIDKYKDLNISVIPFVDSTKLIELVKNNGCFILPSTKEPWGVVVHEFSLSGFPCLISKEVGSTPSFVINDYNGYTFDPFVPHSLVNVMLKMSKSTDEELRCMSNRSNNLGNRITTETSVANLLSLI